MVCVCDDNTIIRSCPPYANVNDVNELLAAICPNCSAVVAPGTDKSLFCAEFGGSIDECCEYLIVFEGSNIWLSPDCSTWITINTFDWSVSDIWSVGDIKESSNTADVSKLWLLIDGRTIGNAASGGTARANNDMLTLFTHLWDKTANTELIIQTSLGVPTVRGDIAAIDFAANKRMPLFDGRGRIIGGMDNPSGASPANRITNAQADLMGGSMGTETHTLLMAEVPVGLFPRTAYNVGDVYRSAGYSTLDGVGNNSTSVGGGGAHNNVQPTLFLNRFIYTGN